MSDHDIPTSRTRIVYEPVDEALLRGGPFMISGYVIAGGVRLGDYSARARDLWYRARHDPREPDDDEEPEDEEPEEESPTGAGGLVFHGAVHTVHPCFRAGCPVLEGRGEVPGTSMDEVRARIAELLRRKGFEADPASW